MIIDVLKEQKLKNMTSEELNTVRNNIIQVLNSRRQRVPDEFTANQKKAEKARQLEGLKKNAYDLSVMLYGTRFGSKIQQLMELEKYTEVIDKIAKFDFKKRDQFGRPFKNISRYGDHNQNHVRAILVKLAIEERTAQDEAGNWIDTEDAFRAYGVGSDDLVGQVEGLDDKEVHDLTKNDEDLEKIFWQVIEKVKGRDTSWYTGDSQYCFCTAFGHETVEPLDCKIPKQFGPSATKLADLAKTEINKEKLDEHERRKSAKSGR